MQQDEAIRQRQMMTRGQMGIGYGGDPNLFNLQQMGQAGDWNSQLEQFLQNWQGDPKHIPGHIQKFAPFWFANLLHTPQAQQIMDPNQFLGASYNPAATQIEGGTNAALRSARGMIANQGMGGSGAYPMLEAQMRSQAAGQRGDILSRLKAEQAYGSWGLLRDVAGMGFGYGPMGQQPQRFDWGPLAQAGGQVVGSFVGGGFNKPS